MGKWSQFRLFTIIFILLGLLAACSLNDEDASSFNELDYEKYNLKETYRIVSDRSFIPFQFMEDGELVGFDIDLIHALADEIGFEIEGGKIETANFDKIIPKLNSGEFDIAIAGIGITEERAQEIDFTDPYYESGIAIGVPLDENGINGLEDLNGKTVATRLGSTSVTYIREHVPGAVINMYERLEEVYAAAENGSADAVVHDLPNIEYYISTAEEESLHIVGDLIQTETYGIGVAKGNENLVQALNEGLVRIKENGVYDQIYEKWFGNNGTANRNAMISTVTHPIQ